LSEFLANLRLLLEVVNFLLKVAGAPGIGAALDHGIITHLAVADSILDLVFVLSGALPQFLRLTQQVVRALGRSLPQEPGMTATGLGNLQRRLRLTRQRTFLGSELVATGIIPAEIPFSLWFSRHFRPQ
jgi:hypothetical protein